MVSMFVALAHCGVEVITWLCLASALMLQFLEPDDANFNFGPNPTSILFIYALLPSAAAGLISWYMIAVLQQNDVLQMNCAVQ